MGVALQIVGGMLTAVGAIFGMLVVLGIGNESGPGVLTDLRHWWNSFAFQPDSEMAGRLKNVLGFVMFVAPGLFLFRTGRQASKPKPRQR